MVYSKQIKFISSLFLIHLFYKKNVCIEMNVQSCHKMSGSENEDLENDLHVELQAQQEEWTDGIYEGSASNSNRQLSPVCMPIYFRVGVVDLCQSPASMRMRAYYKLCYTDECTFIHVTAFCQLPSRLTFQTQAKCQLLPRTCTDPLCHFSCLLRGAKYFKRQISLFSVGSAN